MSKAKNLYKKFDGLSAVAKTSLALIFAKFFQKGLAMISSPLFTRIMSSSEYGVVSTFLSWQSVLYIIATLNMSSGVFNNGMLEFKDDRNRFTFSILMLANTCTLICTGVYFLLYRWAAPLIDMPNILMILLLIYFFVTPAYNYWMGRCRFEYRYISVLLVTIGTSLCSTALAVALVIMAPEGSKGVARVTGTETVSIIVGLIFYVYTIFKAKFKVNLKYWKYALLINLPLVPHYLSMYVLSSSDRIMITNLVSTSKTAIYSVSYNVASIVLMLWNSVDAAYAPWIYQKMAEKNYKALQKRAQELIILFGGGAIFITLFAPEIIRILAPEEYYEGVYIIPAVVAGVFFTAVFSLYMRIELYLKKSSTIMAATVGAAAVNIVLNFIFIRKAGYWAAGYTTMVCYMLLAVFHAFNLKRLGYGNVYNNKFIVLMSVVLCGLIISVSALYTRTVLRYIVIFILFAIGLWKRKFITELIKKQR